MADPNIPEAQENGKHTPGPWVCDCDHVETKASGHIVAHVYGQHPTYEANARLIAAAPELLEALKEAKEAIRSFHNLPMIGSMPAAQVDNIWRIYDGQSPEMGRINAAIAKAEGTDD